MKFPELDHYSGSWMATSPQGRVCELFERSDALKAFYAQWRVETAHQYLARLNRQGGVIEEIPPS